MNPTRLWLLTVLALCLLGLWCLWTAGVPGWAVLVVLYGVCWLLAGLLLRTTGDDERETFRW